MEARISNKLTGIFFLAGISLSVLLGIILSTLKIEKIIAIVNISIAVFMIIYCYVHNKTIDFFSPQWIFPLMFLIIMRTFNIERVIELVRWIQLKNYAAYLSHRKKKLGLAELFW